MRQSFVSVTLVRLPSFSSRFHFRFSLAFPLFPPNRTSIYPRIACFSCVSLAFILTSYSLLRNKHFSFSVVCFLCEVSLTMGVPGTSEMADFGTFHGHDPLLPPRTVYFEVIAPHDDSVMFAVTADTTPVLNVEARRWKRPASMTD